MRLFNAAAIIGAFVAIPASAAPDVAKGAAAFRSGSCAACHSLAPGRNMAGPSLAGVVGRKIGKAAGYKYSADFAKATGKWDVRSLDTYLVNPRAMFPSSKMATRVMAADQRAAIIAYLAANPQK